MRTSLVLAACLLATVCSGPAPKGKPAPEPDEARLPLRSVYSTNGQKGLRAVTKRPGEAYAEDLTLIAREVRGGSPNVLLVRGDGIGEAVAATRRAFTGAVLADQPVRPEGESVPASLWMVAFLSVEGSEPAAWLVRSAERKGKVVRLSVERPKRGDASKDMHPYFVWVPLGKLAAGRYTLELYDAGSKEVTLMRRVTVPGR
jgi:hypothetical protein